MARKVRGACISHYDVSWSPGCIMKCAKDRVSSGSVLTTRRSTLGLTLASTCYFIPTWAAPDARSRGPSHRGRFPSL